MEKTKYIAEDGFQFEASSSLEVVEILRNSSRFDSEKSIEQFMIDFAGRLKIYSGHSIDSTTTDTFLDGLLNSEWLKIQ